MKEENDFYDYASMFMPFVKGLCRKKLTVDEYKMLSVISELIDDILDEYEESMDEEFEEDNECQDCDEDCSNDELNVQYVCDANDLKNKETQDCNHRKKDIKKLASEILSDIFLTIEDINSDEYSENVLVVEVSSEYNNYFNGLTARESVELAEMIRDYLIEKHFDVTLKSFMTDVIDDEDMDHFLKIKW